MLGTAVLGGLLTAIYRGGVELPTSITAEQAATAGETLGGATDVARSLPAEAAAELLVSARAAFDSGVVVTSAIGVALMIGAAVLAGVTLRRA